MRFLEEHAVSQLVPDLPPLKSSESFTCRCSLLCCCALLGRVAVHWRISLFSSFACASSQFLHEFDLPTWQVKKYRADEAIKGGSMLIQFCLKSTGTVLIPPPAFIFRSNHQGPAGLLVPFQHCGLVQGLTGLRAADTQAFGRLGT